MEQQRNSRAFPLFTQHPTPITRRLTPTPEPPTMDPTPTLKAHARQTLIEYSDMQARTGLQMIRNAIEADPRLMEAYPHLLKSLFRLEDEIAASRGSGPPLTPSESVT